MTQYVSGYVTNLAEGDDENEDEITCAIYFNGIEDDCILAKISVPARSFSLRDNLTITIEKSKEHPKVNG